MHFTDKRTLLVRVDKKDLDDLNDTTSFTAVKGTIVNYTADRHFTIPKVDNQVYFMPIRATKISDPSSFEPMPYSHVYYFIKKSKHNIIATSTKPFKKHEFVAK